MIRTSLWFISIILLASLLGGCLAMDPQQMSQYLAARATEAAVSQAIAAARATEAAAAALEATATAEAGQAAVEATAPPPTETPTPAPTETPTPEPTATPTEAPTVEPTPTPTEAPTVEPTPTPAAVLTVPGRVRVNVRSGPGLSWAPFTTIAPGETYAIVGRNEQRTWWLICCVADGQKGWVSATVTRASGDLDSVPVIHPVLPEDMTAQWRITWECHSPGCKFDRCEGQSTASVRRVLSDQWLEVQRRATWEGECGEPTTWLVQVDRYSGEEKVEEEGAQLFRIFEGPANVGEPNRTYTWKGQQQPIWCTDTRTREEEQGGGWTVVFEGEACYDPQSGLMVTMGYVKRWLFTGTFEGRTYEREYFGDYEVYEQVLEETNVQLSAPIE